MNKTIIILETIMKLQHEQNEQNEMYHQKTGFINYNKFYEFCTDLSMELLDELVKIERQRIKSITNNLGMQEIINPWGDDNV